MTNLRWLYDAISSRGLDFIMLFLAVTLGFVAENYRENQVIEANLQQNYSAMLKELAKDREQIDRIHRPHVKRGRALMELEHALYSYQNGQITYDSLVEAVLDLDTVPSYTTVFINNATYKSIQSMGYMAAIPDAELKLVLTNYYETMTKRLEDNNVLFDQEGATFFNEKMPVLKEKWLRDDEDLGVYGHPTDTAFNDLKTYQRWVLTRPQAKAYMSTVRAIHDVETYRLRYLVYCLSVAQMHSENMKLTEFLEKAHLD
jgi:hypothetical protein